MAYKARVTKAKPGVYTLTYGKGAKRLRGVLGKDGRGWKAKQTGVSEYQAATFHRSTKRDAVRAWEEWAADAYGTPKPTARAERAAKLAHEASMRSASWYAKKATAPAVEEEPKATAWTPIDALEYLLDHAKRNRRRLDLPPYSEGLRVLRRESPERAAALERV